MLDQHATRCRRLLFSECGCMGHRRRTKGVPFCCGSRVFFFCGDDVCMWERADVHMDFGYPRVFLFFGGILLHISLGMPGCTDWENTVLLATAMCCAFIVCMCVCVCNKHSIEEKHRPDTRCQVFKINWTINFKFYRFSFLWQKVRNYDLLETFLNNVEVFELWPLHVQQVCVSLTVSQTIWNWEMLKK